MSKELFTKEETKAMLEQLSDLMHKTNANSKEEVFSMDYFVLLNQFYKKARA